MLREDVVFVCVICAVRVNTGNVQKVDPPQMFGGESLEVIEVMDEDSCKK